MAFLIPRYDPWLVAVSVLIASFASYVTLDLAKRVRTQDRNVGLLWWAGGSLVMGTGIWSMHFVGMLAFSIATPLGYARGLTALSWLAAVAVSAVALSIASTGRLKAQRLVGGSLAMGGGICAMHYTGMAALDMAPPIVWAWTWVGASALIAVTASGVALMLFFWLRQVSDRRGVYYQLAAAVVMGLAISGMHYTGMFAANFPQGTLCLSAGALSGDLLGMLVIIASISLLGVTLFTSVLDARMRGRTTWLADSLQVANAELRAANEELHRRAFQDALTGLANRMLFEDRLSHALLRCERMTAKGDGVEGQRARLAVLFIDLDGFKPVNDSLGHASGDLVLKDVAKRLLELARQSDTVARVGGDEFLVLMEDVADPQDCAALARRFVDAMRQPFELDERRVHISCSIGISLYPDHGNQQNLVTRADAAMYAAKRAGGSGYAVFEPRMDSGALEQLTLQTELREALAGGQLELHYQPKLGVRQVSVVGAEALIRWNHPTRGMLAPGLFIPLAERCGLITEIGNWVIDEACRQMGEWTKEGVRMFVAINLSAHQLRQEDLVARIRQALERHQLEPAQLLCEITETVAMEDTAVTHAVFDGLRELGVFLSIDDFGTGYCSLSYLRQLPAQQLKIDRSFVMDLDTSSHARSVVQAVVHLAHALDLKVVAEGVETDKQRDILLQLGCDELQGYLFARPMPAGMLLPWIAQGPGVDRKALRAYAVTRPQSVSGLMGLSR
jgi:diguanylate cyclase (GGDEF)-like protein